MAVVGKEKKVIDEYYPVFKIGNMSKVFLVLRGGSTMVEKEKMHKVNVNLCELDFRQFEAMVKATGMSKSDLIRQFIHSPKSINVRYDADRVIREMGRVQESLNSKYHFMLDELDVKSKEIAELKTRLNLNIPLDRPAEISCAELETGIEKMRIVVERVKEAHDKELYEIVNF